MSIGRKVSFLCKWFSTWWSMKIAQSLSGWKMYAWDTLYWRAWCQVSESTVLNLALLIVSHRPWTMSSYGERNKSQSNRCHKPGRLWVCHELICVKCLAPGLECSHYLININIIIIVIVIVVFIVILYREKNEVEIQQLPRKRKDFSQSWERSRRRKH